MNSPQATDVEWLDEETTWPGVERGARVLLAEDDDELRAIVANLLQMDGHDVVEVANGSEMLLALGRNETFDLIVTDVRMPGLSGLDVVRHLRRRGCGTPVIALTSFPDDDIRDRAEALDTLLVAKPFSLRALRSAVDFYLGLQSSYRRSVSWKA